MLIDKNLFIAAILLVSIISTVKGQAIALRYPEYDIKDSSLQDTILLQLTGMQSIVNESNFKIIKKGVRFGQRSEQRLFNAFSVDQQLVNHSIRIIINTKETKFTGIYELSLDVFDGASYIPLLAKFNHQPAVLRDLVDMTITQQAPFFSSPSIIESSPLTLEEMSGRSRVQTTFSNIPFKWNTKGQKFSAIHFKQSFVTVEPGKKITIDYVTEGSFPLGQTKLTSEIIAPQLTSAKSLNFTVITKRPLCYIAVVLFLGILSSFCFKTIFTNFINLNESKLKIIDFIDLIIKDQVIHLDSIFKEESDKIKSELSDVAALKLSISALIINYEKERNEIEILLTSTKAKYEIVTKDLDGRRLIEMRNYEDLLVIPFPLPMSLHALFQSVLFDKKEQIAKYFKEDNIEELKNLLAEIKGQLVEDMQNSIKDWKDKITDLVTFLKEHLSSYLTSDAELSSRLASLNTSSIKRLESIDNVKTAITLINTMHVDIEEVVRSYTARLINILIKTKSFILQYYGPSNKLNTLESSMHTYIQKIRSANPEELKDVINQEYSRLVEAWKEVIYQPPLIAPNSQIDDLLHTHRFEEAVQIAIQEIKKISKSPAAAMAGDAVDFQNLSVLITSREVSNFKNYIVKVPTTVPFYGTIERERKSIEKSITSVKIIRIFIVAIVLILIGYFIYDDNFIGKPDELFGIFLWAFTFDLSINTSFDFIATALSKPKTVFQ